MDLLKETTNTQIVCVSSQFVLDVLEYMKIISQLTLIISRLRKFSGEYRRGSREG